MNASENIAIATHQLRECRQQVLRLSQEDPGGVALAKAERALRQVELKHLPSPQDPAAVTTYLFQLREDYLEAKEKQKGGRVLDAWNFWYDESTRLGRSPSALPEFSADESERFFSKVVLGSDGHAYWLGAKMFGVNNGGTTPPRRWWWKQEYDLNLPNSLTVYVTCGEDHCIAPKHCALGTNGRKRLYTDEQLLGKLQTLALRLGHSPSYRDWDESGMDPSTTTFQQWFGTWNEALARAGLQVVQSREHTPEDCLKAIRLVRKQLGHWPNGEEFLRSREVLKRNGLPTTHEAIRRIFGTWSKGLEAARRGVKLGAR